MFVGVNGIKLWYEKRGCGRPVVLLHGNGEDHGVFESLATALENEFELWLPDSRCHGKSEDSKELSYELMAADIAAFISACGIEKPILLGFSDGGIVGLMLAIKYPGLLGGLIACGANAKPSGLKAGFRVNCEAKYLVTRDRLLSLMLYSPDISVEELRTVSVPTVIAAGSKDLVRPNETEKLFRAIPGAEKYIFEGETHDSYVSGCALLAPLVRRMAARL